jgi:hypothetical protein
VPARVIPFPGRPPPPEDDGEFAELIRVRDQAEAVVIRGLLDASGIASVVRTQLAPSVHPFSVGAQGEVRILVPRVALPEARRLLARPASGPGP